MKYWTETEQNSTHLTKVSVSSKCVIPVVCVCVKTGKGTQSNTTMSLKVYLMAILDNYTFRLLLVIFRLSSRRIYIYIYDIHKTMSIKMF